MEVTKSNGIKSNLITSSRKENNKIENISQNSLGIRTCVSTTTYSLAVCYIPAPIRPFHERRIPRVFARRHSHLSVPIGTRGNKLFQPTRSPGPIRNLWPERAHTHTPYVGPKWKDRLARLAVKTSTLVPCVDAYAKSASSVHSQRHPCALTVVHHFWLDGWCAVGKREREREGERYTYYSERRDREGGGRWKEKWNETFTYQYSL